MISLFAWISGLSVFISLGSLIIVLSLFINPKHFDGFIKFFCRLVLRFLFIRVHVEGSGLIDRNKSCIFVSNHVNLFDPFVLYGYIPNFVRGVELETHFNWFFYGLIIRRLGMIPISHADTKGALRSLKLAKKHIQEGISILILPEGGRTLDGNFKSFKRGAFYLAKEAGADIVPLVMVDAYQINHKGSLRIRPGKMTLRFGRPIPSQQLEGLTVKDITTYIHSKMLALFTLRH